MSPRVTSTQVARIRDTQSSMPPVMIKASAGTGKTFQLSNRYLKLILNGHSPDRILATTFTRKAAGEILARILFRLAEAARDKTSAAHLRDELSLPELNVEDCRRSLRDLTRNLHRLRVSTLDSFFLQATQTLSLELGLPPGWEIIDEAQELHLREQAIHAMLHRDDPETVAQLLSWLAKGATHRSVSQLLADTVNGMYSLFLESSGDAWRRLPRLQGCSSHQLQQIDHQLRGWLSAADTNLRLRKAVESILEAMAQGRWDDMMSKGIIKKLVDSDPTYYGKELPDDLVQIVSPLIKHGKAELQNRIALQTEASYELLGRFHREYEMLKLDRRALRFDDLARRLGSRVETTDLAQLSYRLDATVDGLLLDEFQDTSLDQWRVIRPFAQHSTANEPHRSFFCVGDVKQAIYGWRGGNAELMDAVVGEFSQLTCESLDRSYRSAPPIINVINRINTCMDQHENLEQSAPAVVDWVRRFPVHSTSRQELSGYVSLETTDDAPTQEQRRTLAMKRAADRVNELRSAAPQLSIAVLVRTNKLVGQVMYELQKRGILASEEGGNPLTDSAAVQLILSLLKLTDYPQDTAARYHLAHSPWGNLLGLTSHTDGQAAVRLSQTVQCQLADIGYGGVMDHWIGQLRSFTNAREWRRLNQLAELAHRYQQQIESPRDVGYARQHCLPISADEFINRVQQQRISDPTEDPVRVMNVHQSKGLQFDVVILPDLDRKLLPQTPTYAVDRTSATEPIETVVRYAPQNIRCLLPKKIQQVHEQHQTLRVREELSVVYVSLTRAVHCLQMIIAPSDPPAKSSPRRQGRSGSTSTDLPRTVAGLIRASLTDQQTLEPNDVVFEYGDREWWKPLATGTRRARSGVSIDPPRVALRPGATRPSGRSERKVRPSMLEGGGRVRLTDRLSLPAHKAMQRGSLIHAFFEQIEWIDEGQPTEEILRSVGRSWNVDVVELDGAVSAFRRMLNRSSIRSVLSVDRYQEWTKDAVNATEARKQLDVRREQRVTVHDSEGWLTGDIDRLVVFRPTGTPVAAEILDFKTDSIVEKSSLSDLVDHYRPQLLAYRRGASRMLCIDIQQVSAALVFVSEGRVIPVAPPK